MFKVTITACLRSKNKVVRRGEGKQLSSNLRPGSTTIFLKSNFKCPQKEFSGAVEMFSALECGSHSCTKSTELFTFNYLKFLHQLKEKKILVAHTLKVMSRRYFHWEYKRRIKMVLFLILFNKHCKNGKDCNNNKKLENYQRCV